MSRNRLIDVPHFCIFQKMARKANNFLAFLFDVRNTYMKIQIFVYFFHLLSYDVIYSYIRGLYMKKIEAIIRPDVFAEVRKALALEGIDGLSVTEIAGCGRQEGRTGLFRGNAFEMEFYTKLKLEMVVEDHLVESLVETILTHASTNEIGDGKIFVLPVEEAIRIRTRERGAIAVN